MTCACRSSATCADHLAEADLTLQPTPFGRQVLTRSLPEELERVLRDIPESLLTRLRGLVRA